MLPANIFAISALVRQCIRYFYKHVNEQRRLSQSAEILPSRTDRHRTSRPAGCDCTTQHATSYAPVGYTVELPSAHWEGQL